MASLDQVIDHAAQLQTRIDRLSDELLACQLCVLALCALVAIVAYQTRERRR